MKGRNRLIAAALLLVAGVVTWFVYVAAKPQITFFETYGYQSGDHWVVPLQLRVWERGLRQRGLERSLARAASEAERLSGGQIDGLDKDRFRRRIAAFVADQEGDQRITIAFDKDPKDRRFPVTHSSSGEVLRSNSNGRIDGQIHVPLDAAAELLQAQGSQHGYLTYSAVDHGQTGKGKMRLIPDTADAVSVISDIDDTIKVTEVPAGGRVMYRNTFVHEFQSSPGMAKLYEQWADAPFHYVSGGPWQMYEPLFEFLPGQGFPSGSVHMRNLPLVLSGPDSMQDVLTFLLDKEATAKHKVARIREIMGHFQHRKFVFVGDSGEADPEVYREIRDDRGLGSRVQAIYIRTVTESKPGRLDGMQLIEAKLVREGQSEFGR